MFTILSATLHEAKERESKIAILLIIFRNQGVDVNNRKYRDIGKVENNEKTLLNFLNILSIDMNGMLQTNNNILLN